MNDARGENIATDSNQARERVHACGHLISDNYATRTTPRRLAALIEAEINSLLVSCGLCLADRAALCVAADKLLDQLRQSRLECITFESYDQFRLACATTLTCLDRLDDETRQNIDGQDTGMSAPLSDVLTSALDNC